jgi:hypothetical protein
MKEYNFSKPGSVSILRWEKLGRHLLSLVCYNEPVSVISFSNWPSRYSRGFESLRTLSPPPPYSSTCNWPCWALNHTRCEPVQCTSYDVMNCSVSTRLQWRHTTRSGPSGPFDGCSKLFCSQSVGSVCLRGTDGEHLARRKVRKREARLFTWLICPTFLGTGIAGFCTRRGFFVCRYTDHCAKDICGTQC